MYVSTFYSFKGGVGRTMALVNAAVELAQRGRKVLAVDFDLEAPGLDTFEALCAPPGSAGIVDFVSEYLATGQAQDVERFVTPSTTVDGLWIMPSGSQQGYAAIFGGIDWNGLYEQHSGYLLFEDLKEQWRKVVQPDYVLIDSRTGHTDTCGICTRQLPDAVTLLFFPNEQNLRGLAKVVRDIRSEAEVPQGRPIDTHFVMSNVPDLDDEDDILQRMLARFTAELGMEDEPQVIHRYDSLSLVNQVVFTRDRPKSRLAKEYCGVVDLVVRGNVEDEDGALHYIEEAERSFDPPHDIERKLTKIEEHHAKNGEVLFRLGELASDEGNWPRARSLLDRAVSVGNHTPGCLLARARVWTHMGDDAAARADAKRVLSESHLTSQAAREAIRLAALDVPEDTGELPAVAMMDGWRKIWLADQLERDGETQACISVLRSALHDAAEANLRDRVREQLVLSLVAIGETDEVCELLGSNGTQPATMNVADAFNYGMATWGRTGDPPREAFERVVSLHKADGGKPGANYLQCMAIAYWVVGEAEEAMEFARRAKVEAEATLRPTFSCWCYRTVATQDFLQDTDSIMRLIAGEAGVVPEFIKRGVAARGKYAPLFHHLDVLDARQWPATFRDIESVLGFALPKSARVHRPWWSNQAGRGHSHAVAWQAAGWRTSAVDLKAETLVFVRSEEAGVSTTAAQALAMPEPSAGERQGQR